MLPALSKIAELARLSGMKFERNGSFFNHDLRTRKVRGTFSPHGNDIALTVDTVIANRIKIGFP